MDADPKDAVLIRPEEYSAVAWIRVDQIAHKYKKP